MKCESCGSLLKENESFCSNCGAPVVNRMVQNNIQGGQPVYYQHPAKKNKIVFVIVGLIFLAVIALITFIILKDSNNISNNSNNTEKESIIANTTWTTGDGSQVVFTKERIDWYRYPDDHNDNYYSGKYKFYIGKEAVKYVTEELKEYGLTKEELEDIFERSEKYDESNFIVFDIRYDKFILEGEEQKITRPLVPWYGFILNNNTFLDVANMNTGTYYDFTKQK